MIFILNKLEQLSRAELSATYFHAENLLFRGFKIMSVTATQNEKFYTDRLRFKITSICTTLL